MKLYIFIAIALLMYGCNGGDKHVVYSKTKDIDQNTWHKDSALNFSFTITNPSKAYNIYYVIEHTADYNYRNLYLKYYLKNPEEDTLQSDLQNLLLFDSKSGKPTGESNFLSDLYTARFKAINKKKFNDEGSYTIGVRQFMRVDKLKEIESLKLIVTEN